ncbi:0c17c2d5-564d-493d-898d-052f99eb5589 [Sclerotinia trifoliorum]|uniref:0c17c2d5-564d-493d-898d-052f99eb5589 n=1 Tax=Sclerotinia trifoliorum TaxID=28548 RepID=A0A8H2VY53_9HELO|nr:0c17c2d5-564d-493d-898d-052f99eb5589 [Sclerotinia trifoliorum]
MPKDWASIKDELEQLYVTEGRTLEQVRETLISTRGFGASIRMYRMMLREWGIKKYKSNNKCGHPCPRHPRSAPSVEPEDSDNAEDALKDIDLLLRLNDDHSKPESFMELFINENATQAPNSINPAHNTNTPSSSNSHTFEKSHSGFNDPSMSESALAGQVQATTILSRPMRLSELLPLIHNLYSVEHAFVPLLRKWQSDGEYMACAISWLNNPAHCKNILGSSRTGSNHFKLIDENVPFPERITLTKAFLKASIVHHVVPSQSIWSVIWSYTRYVDQWKTVKDNLLDASSGFIEEPGSVFHLCALAVMGEELLQGYKNRLEALRTDAQSLTVSRIEDAKSLCQQYIDILKDFRDQEVDVDISFYKYSLEILDWNEALAAQERSKTDRLLGKYRRLVGLLTGNSQSWIDGSVDRMIENAERRCLAGNSMSSPGPSLAPEMF